MAKTKEQKQGIIRDLEEKISGQKTMVFMDFTGVDSDELFQLRRKLKETGCELKVVKKTLFEKALEKLNKKNIIEEIKKIKNQIVLIFGFNDEITASKFAYEAGKSNENFIILGGALGADCLTKEKIICLAQLPSRQELLAKITRSLQNPVSGFVGALKANLNNLVFVLSKIKK